LKSGLPKPTVYLTGMAAICLSAAAVADPNFAVEGRWSEVQDWPVVAVHAALMSNGKVMAWDAWDGDLLLAGGDDFPGGAPGTAEGASSNSNMFHPEDNSWTRLENMQAARWYATAAALPNGEILTFGGNYGLNAFGEVLGLDRRWRPLPLESQMPYQYSGDYQWLHVTPAGQVASLGPHNTLGLIDTAGSGKWQTLPNVRDEIGYRGYGSFAPYAEGRVLVTGGVGYTDAGAASERSAVVLDLHTMQSSPTTDMLYARSQHNLTVLPNGQVLATGGHSSTEVLIDLEAPVLPSEIWNPTDGQWTEMAALGRTRQYHSISLLLPDARVLVAGGGYCGACTTENYHEQNAEIYSPPYLFDSLGNPAVRPVISDTPERVNYGSAFEFSVESSNDISNVVMLKPGTTTHSHNQDQRHMQLAFTRAEGVLTATAPANQNLAPPGYYLLFALDSKGVPSKGRFVLVGQPTLNLGQAVAQNIRVDQQDIYAFESYAGDPALRVELSEIEGDVDLYIQSEQYPDASADGVYKCGSAAFGDANEVCEIPNPGRQTWYIGVSGWEDSDYQLEVSLKLVDDATSGSIDPEKFPKLAEDETEEVEASDGGGGVLGLLLLMLSGLGCFKLYVHRRAWPAH